MNKEMLLDKLMNETTKYESIEEYGRETFLEDEEFTWDDFSELRADGFIQDITLGTYNGATDTFTERKIDKYHIYDALRTYLHETDFVDVMRLDGRDNEVTDDEMVEELSDMYVVIIIGNSLYLDRN